MVDDTLSLVYVPQSSSFFVKAKSAFIVWMNDRISDIAVGTMKSSLSMIVIYRLLVLWMP